MKTTQANKNNNRKLKAYTLTLEIEVAGKAALANYKEAVVMTGQDFARLGAFLKETLTPEQFAAMQALNTQVQRFTF